MKPIPVAWHLGPLVFHTYGLGLALTFYFAYRYLRRRLAEHGLPYEWLGRTAAYVVVAALVGARLMHVIANAGYYVTQPVQVLEVWNGGLSSFGGLALGVPTGFLMARHKCQQVRSLVLADLVAPVLLASWALGRLLGPQLMYAGGGHPTHQWFGMYYAGQVGRRLPVPLFQAALTAAVLLIVWQVERYAQRRDLGPGLVISVAAGFWGLDRFVEEHLWLAYPGHPGAVAVQVVGLVLFAGGFGIAAAVLFRGSRHLSPASPASPGPTGPAPADDASASPGPSSGATVKAETQTVPG
jgi:phosphatidylglycerol:prolipoprotein diacylglycerol transferase